MIVNQGKTVVLFSGVLTGASPRLHNFILDADLLLVSVYVRSVTGSVSVVVNTFTQTGEDREVIALGPFVAPTADLQFATANPTMANHQLVITYTGSCDIEVVAKGLVASTLTSVKVHDDDGDELEINPDGSINVTVLSGGGDTETTTYAEVSAVPMSTPTIVQTYVVPAGVVKLDRVAVSGTNIAEYLVKRNAVVLDRRRTYFGGALNTDFVFENLLVTAGDVITVTVTHLRSFVGDFNSRIQVVES